jgi:spoIIIJ-associated protein
VSELTVEATGETVGEAKWKALRDLEQRAPGLDKAAVKFQVLSEGERGLLGVGYTPARVIASVAADAVVVAEEPGPDDQTELERHVRDLLSHVTAAMGLRCRIDVQETEDSVVATCTGGDLGLLIGKHGQTIDAVQYLANAITARGEDRKPVVVDASGYRDRRQRTLESLAVRSAERAVASAQRVELEPMSSVERKLVHECLKDYPGVETTSEGVEPHRYVVVVPA